MNGYWRYVPRSPWRRHSSFPQPPCWSPWTERNERVAAVWMLREPLRKPLDQISRFLPQNRHRAVVYTYLFWNMYPPHLIIRIYKSPLIITHFLTMRLHEKFSLSNLMKGKLVCPVSLGNVVYESFTLLQHINFPGLQTTRQEKTDTSFIRAVNMRGQKNSEMKPTYY